MAGNNVVIIGAGAAGLTAAYDLIRQSDLSVTVLEAHATLIGGRLRKLPTTNEDLSDFPIDIGGEWIHLEGPGILDRILDDPEIKGGWKTYAYKPDFRIYDEEDGTFESDNFFDKVGDYHFIDYTWFDFFNDHIAPTVVSKVVFGCVVTTIDYTSAAANGLVAIKCGNGQTFQANKVIVTVPLRILQGGSIAFNPPLPQSKMDALENEVEMPPGAKLFLKFNRDFYHDAFQTAPTATGERFFYDAALNQGSSDFILGMLTLGDQAPNGQTAESFKDSALQILDTMYGGTVASDSFVSFFLQDWTAEPFILGTYSDYVNSGNCDDVIELIREPVGDNRIFFAGEHLPIDEQWGFVHGAALSGRAAAQRVMSSNGGNDDGPSGILGLFLAILGFCFT